MASTTRATHVRMSPRTKTDSKIPMDAPISTMTTTASPIAKINAPACPRTKTGSRTLTAARSSITIKTVFRTRSTNVPMSRRTKTDSKIPMDCPDLDNDEDGFPDAVDRCPNEPETINGFNDDDGCPDTQDLHVDGDFIVLDDRIHFDTDSAKVKVKSWALIQHLAAFLEEHPEYALVHVAGHADDTGTPEYNLALSEARGRSVRDMLIRFGVESARLTIEAYGQTRPRENGKSPRARTENRRVELEILTRAPPQRIKRESQ